MPTPLIAVPTYRLAPGRVLGWGSRTAFAAPAAYVEALRRAGGRPVLLTHPEPDPEATIEGVDGLLVIGGGDVEPTRYGRPPHPSVAGVDGDRDAAEIGLLRAAAARGLPTLAICRGAQIMNVAFGGALIQHLPETTPLPHDDRDDDAPSFHDVRTDDASSLRSACGEPVLHCASRHHQGIETLGDGLRATAWTDDGLTEGIERTGGWMVGVQWHPEETAATDPAQQGLFDALVAEASRYAANGRSRSNGSL